MLLAANTPMLELYTTLSRSQIDVDEVILEESIDGMDLVAGVIFADAEGGSGTDVTFRLGYYLPGELPARHACRMSSRNLAFPSTFHYGFKYQWNHQIDKIKDKFSF